MKLTRLTARSRHGISRSIKREKLEKEGRKTTRRGACCVRIRPEQVFSSAGLARATASEAAAVKHGTDAWPKKSCPVHQAGNMKESRKLGADSPVPATPTPAPPAPVAPVPPPAGAGPRRMALAPRQQLGSK